MQTFTIIIKNADGSIASSGNVQALNRLAALQIARTLTGPGQRAIVQ